MISARFTVYAASPLGFSEPGRHYYRSVLLPALVAADMSVLDPWSVGGDAVGEAMAIHDPVIRGMSLRKANSRIGRQNAEMIAEASAILAIVDGPDVDSGTAAEVGYACALHRPIVGLRTDLRSAGDNAATEINLQVLYFIEVSGGSLVRSLDEAVKRLQLIRHLARRDESNASPQGS